ncbi:MAG: redoxin domain-containing protein [Acidobacteria bacterium]|nr:redoxin domain-containing protein [Acidobacteriota bacterium]
MEEKRDVTPNSRRFPAMLVVVPMAPVCLGLLLAAATHDMARSGTGAPPEIPRATSRPADAAPDWAVVQDYLDQQNAWRERTSGVAMADLSADERDRRFQDAFAERPNIRPAIAAATAIVDAGGHDRTREAAEFLVMQTLTEPDADQHMYRGAQALVAEAPDDERWPSILMRMDGRRFYGPDGESSTRGIDRFFEEMASGAPRPALRATARYYVAAGLMQSANGAMVGEEERDGRRQRALDAATGLSAGVEDRPFGGARAAAADPSAVAPAGPFGRPDARTFAQAEADLIRTIEHATVGGTALDMTGRRLDGAEDSLSAYRGRVVLIDFWATWCRPCIDVLPELRELVGELPADRFTLLAISVDEQLETVTRLIEREPMPWTNWHAGIDSDIERAWAVRGFPTYVLVDEEGLILARTNHFSPRFTEMLGAAVAGEELPAREAGDAENMPNVAELRPAAEQGDPEAQFHLGSAYQSGTGVPEDDAEAVAWYLRAAEQGYANAQFALGFAYSNGEGVALDNAESLAWFLRAAEQGHDAAQWMLGTTYSWGLRGTPRDDIAAYMWLHLAVSQNDGHDRSPLDQLEARMSPAQIAEAQRLAREWREAHR